MLGVPLHFTRWCDAASNHNPAQTAACQLSRNKPNYALDGSCQAEPSRRGPNPRLAQRLLELLDSSACTHYTNQNKHMKTRITMLGLLLLLVLCGCKPKTFRQVTAAMEPTIKKGEVILADTAAYSGAAPARWDVIVFTEPKSRQTRCYRVVGLPGESIDIRPQGIFVNGATAPLPARLTNLVHLPAIPNGPPPTVSFPFSIPAGSYFVLGDNPTNADDSRYWGALPGQNITGRVNGK